jgi:pyruvate kinase
MTPNVETRRKVALYRGVYPLPFMTHEMKSHAEANVKVVSLLEESDVVSDGDLMIITKGDLMGDGGGTNAMKIVEVGNLVEPY